MAKLKDAIQSSQEKYEQAKDRQRQKRTNRPISTSGLVQYFNDLYHIYGLGSPPPINEDTRNKINGLVKNLKKNGYDDSEIWDFLRRIFENWDYLKHLNFYTDNRKSYILATLPDLKDVVNCKTQFIQELSREEDKMHNECNSGQNEEEDQPDLLEVWRQMNDD